MSLTVAGLDLALSATGIAGPHGLATIKSRYGAGPLRLVDLRDQILAHLDADEHRPYLGADLVVIEGYAYGAGGKGGKHGGTTSHAHALGELGGVVRVALLEAAIAYVDVPPACLKRYATGRGNAAKDEVLVACVRRLQLEPHNNNEGDAAWLQAMALDHYGQPTAAMPAAHRSALDKIAWPTRTTTVATGSAL